MKAALIRLEYFLDQSERVERELRVLRRELPIEVYREFCEMRRKNKGLKEKIDGMDWINSRCR